MNRPLLATALSAALLAGCAAPITYYSRTPDASKPGTISFRVAAGGYSTVALYSDPVACHGIQRVAFFKAGVDETVHVPRDKYVTFSVYVQTPGVSQFKSASRMVTVPFDTGELRVDVDVDAQGIVTHIESRDPKAGWRPVEDAALRVPRQPFLESGAWCQAEDRFAS